MNKKKLVTTLGSLALVGAIGVGATLAYFSDQATEVKNTFSLTEGLDIELDESDQSGTSYIADTTETKKRVKTNNYLNVAPGQTLYKDPQVTVVKNETPQWVFMSVLESENVIVKDYSVEWTEMDSDVTGVKVYYMAVNSNTQDQHTDVDTNYLQPGVQLPKLFEHVTVTNTDDPGLKLDDIKVKAATIQQEGYTVEEAYQLAKDFLTSFSE